MNDPPPSENPDNEPRTMSAFIVEKCEYERSEIVAWFPTLDEAQRWCLEHGPKERYDDDLRIIELLADHTVNYLDEWFTFVPEPYRGPLVRARISVRQPSGVNEQGISTVSVHRIPIDCWKPRPDEELTEDEPWRIVANSFGEGPLYPDPANPQSYWTCMCGEWQEVEGSPDKVAELVAKYPCS